MAVKSDDAPLTVNVAAGSTEPCTIVHAIDRCAAVGQVVRL